MARERPTIIVKGGSVLRKVVKVWFGGDGSYYVTVPYHSENAAHLGKMTVNYDKESRFWVEETDLLDLGAVSDEARVKLAHHPDGFCQFSGKGVTSGKDESGAARGLAVQTSEISAIGRGPSFVVSIQGLECLQETDKAKDGDVVFHLEDLEAAGPTNALSIEGHYFHPYQRRFIARSSQGRHISVQHPSGLVLRMPVLLAPESVAYPGFFGIHCYRLSMNLPAPGYTMTSRAENPRRDDHGDRVADMLMGCFPPPHGDARSLDYPPG